MLPNRIRKRRLAWLAGLTWGFLLVCGAPFRSLALVPSPADWGGLTGPAEKELQGTVSSESIPDLQVAWAVDGKVVWSEVLHGRTGSSCTTETEFRIGSVAKTLTATALLKLVEEGKIDLDQPITQYFPCEVPQAEAMTARMLAGHLAGIRHYQGAEAFNSVHYATLQAGLAIFSGSPLVAPPGTRYSYSSYGFNLLGCVMEAAAREDFPALMKELVLQPLRMTHTEIDDLTHSLPATAPIYERSLLGMVLPVTPSDDSYKWPSGGYLSTAEDLTRLGDAYLDAGFLSAASLRLAETSQTAADGKPTGYSLGWMVTRDRANNVVIEHSGSSVGGASWLCVCPAKKSVFAAVWNVGGADKAVLPVVIRAGRELREALP